MQHVIVIHKDDVTAHALKSFRRPASALEHQEISIVSPISPGDLQNELPLARSERSSGSFCSGRLYEAGGGILFYKMIVECVAEEEVKCLVRRIDLRLRSPGLPVQSILHFHRGDVRESLGSDILEYSGPDVREELPAGAPGHVHLVSGYAAFGPDGQRGVLVNDRRVVLQLPELLRVPSSELDLIVGIDRVSLTLICESFPVFILFHRSFVQLS